MAYADDLRWGNAPQHFFRHLLVMPGWHKGVLLLGVVLGIIGGTGWFMNKAAAQQGAASGVTVSEPEPAQTHGPRASSGTGLQTSPGSPRVEATAGTGLSGRMANLSTPSMKLGFSVLAGFVFGWVFRGFLKTMAFLALVLFGLFAALSYFHVLNVDLTRAKAEYVTAMQWATDQFWKLKDVLVAHLPSSSGGTVGAFLGFKRR